MRYTENLNLKKPEQTEFYDVDDFNENADIIDTELMNRLKVTGGEMTGSITVKNTEILHRDVNNSFLSICGGKNWRDGAYAILHGSTADEKGVFNLGSYDGNLEVNLIGKPTGELTWNSKNIVRSINDITANVDGDVRITTVDNLVIESMPIGQGKTIGELKTALLAWLKRTQGVTAQCMFTADNAWSEHWTDNSYVLKAGSLWTVTSIGNITTHVQAYAHLMFASYASPTVFTATVVESAFTQFKMLGDVNSVNNIRPDGNGNITLPVATAEKYGLVRVAEPTDVLDTVNDAAITPAVYHDVSDFRHKGTAYSLGDKVECMFNHELFLECTKAGTTASTPLDTRNVKHGQVLTDGGVQWTVRTHIKSVNGVVAGADGDVTINVDFPDSVTSLESGFDNIKYTMSDGSTHTVSMTILDRLLKYPRWWGKQSTGSDGDFTPTQDSEMSGTKNYRTVKIPSGVTITVNRQAVIYCDTFVNEGTINGDGRGGVGGSPNGDNPEDGEFGYGARGGNGGSGKDNSSGTYGDPGGYGGTFTTTPWNEETPLSFGGGGGAGSYGSYNSSAGTAGAYGGAGLIVVANSIVNTGTISSKGAKGTGNYTGGGGGGGGGGTVIFIANTVSNTGTVTLDGGKCTGWAAGGTVQPINGEAGSVFIHEWGEN